MTLREKFQYEAYLQKYKKAKTPYLEEKKESLIQKQSLTPEKTYPQNDIESHHCDDIIMENNQDTK